jgi:hypothetical protein
VSDRTVVQLAGVSALLAIPAVVLSVVFIALFFGGAGDVFGSLNDFFIAATALLLVPAAWVVLGIIQRSGAAGRGFAIVTWLAIGGLVLIAAGQLALVVGLIPLEGSFATGTAGILPVIAWALAQLYLGLRLGLPSRAVGWSLVAVLASAALVVVASAIGSDPLAWALTVVFLLAFVGYLAVLGLDLVRRGSSVAPAGLGATS